jgi:hypothetical protein
MPCGCGCGETLAINYIVSCHSCELKPNTPTHNFKITSACRASNRHCSICQSETGAIVQDEGVIETKKKTKNSGVPKEAHAAKKPKKSKISKVNALKELKEVLELENGEQDLKLKEKHVGNVEDP